MNYTGKLYGKGHGRTYFPLVLTSEDVDAMHEENRHLKDMLATLSKNHATDMQRLSDMIDKRQEALRYISEIIEEKAAEREDLELGSKAYKSVRRWASEFLHNAKEHTTPTDPKH
jgi:predicted DNA-binding protein